MYAIQDKEAGNVIETFATLEEAEKILDSYIEDDENQGIENDDFYEIVKRDEDNGIWVTI